MATTTTGNSASLGSVFDLPGKSYRIVKDNWKMFGLAALPALLSGVAALFGADTEKQYENKDYNFSGLENASFASNLSGLELAGVIGLGLVGLAIAIAIGLIFNALTYSVQARTSRGEKPVFNDLWEDVKKYWFRLFLLVLLSGLIVAVGFILLIVPGIIAIARLVYAPYLMIDKDLGVIEAIKQSNEFAKGKFTSIWAAVLVFIGVAIVVSIFNSIEYVGPLIGTVLSVLFSLIIVLRLRDLDGKKISA